MIGSLIAHEIMFKKDIIEKEKKQEKKSTKIKEVGWRKEEIYCIENSTIDDDERVMLKKKIFKVH